VRPHARHHRPLWAASGLLGLLTLLVTACTPVARYEVLSFFFDGVPPPPGVEAPAPTPRRLRRESSFRASLAQLGPPSPMAVPVVYKSIHQPVKENRCLFCHDPNGPMDAVPHDARLCDRCHADKRKQEGWDHGPINLGTCIPCHRSHQSEHDHLLAEPVPALCLHCHDDVEPSQRPEYHQVPDYDRCVPCHDPHKMY